MYSVNMHTDARCDGLVSQFIEMLENDNSKESKSTLKKVIYQFKRLENKGTRVGSPLTKHIKDEIWEMRPGKYRLFYAVDGNQLIFLNWFRKETPKTPENEIAKAEKLYKDWTSKKVSQ